MPCFRAFLETFFFPAGVRGPVDFWALARLAARRLGEIGGLRFEFGGLRWELRFAICAWGDGDAVGRTRGEAVGARGPGTNGYRRRERWWTLCDPSFFWLRARG